MKVLLIICCIFFAAFFDCNASIQKKYVSGNVHNQFNQPFNGDNRSSSKDPTVEGIARLTTSLMHDIYHLAGQNFNIVLSPISIWTIFALLYEGAGGKTENELKAKLNISSVNHEEGRKMVRSRYKELQKLFQDKTGPTEFSSLNFVITDKKLNPEFQSITEEFYDGKHFNFDHKKKGLFSIMMNNWATDKSNGKIHNIISPAMLDNLVMLIGNAVYFKSKWKYPFDPLDTLSLPFKDDNGRFLRNIPMMNMAAVLPLGYNAELESQIIEIPYADDLTSMVIILPHPGVGLKKVLSKMQYLSLNQIVPDNMSEETVQLSLPRFYVVSKMYLNEILKKDLHSMFSSQSAEFPHIGKDVFVSKISHRAEIENTEEGTTASAITSVQFAYKSSPAIFRADHPFIYLINEIKTRTILFAGTFSNPLTASTKF